MTPAEILKNVLDDGVSVSEDGTGTIKLTGDQAAIDKWLPTIREHKATLLEILSPARHTDPEPCHNCTRFEFVEIMGADIPGCLYQAPGEYDDGWKRLPNNLDKCIIH